LVSRQGGCFQKPIRGRGPDFNDALFFVDATARLGWCHDGNSDGRLAVGGAILQDPYFGQEEL
jgi:hypothetical protein